MGKGAYIAGGVLLVWLAAWGHLARAPEAPKAPLRSEVDAALLQNLAIAPRTEALTFARFVRDGQTYLMMVSGYAKGVVSGLVVEGSDPIALFNTNGYDALAALTGPEYKVPAEQLTLPFDGTASQIAAGVNYPAHGEEVSVKDSFLFPKQTLATDHLADVNARDALLDYEVELGFVLLEPLAKGAKPKSMGLVLASDYTDRALLMRNVKLTNVSSGEGFTEGKSPAGYMPVGELFVIPHDYESFYKALKLELWCNGEHRQLAEPAKLTWDIQRILAESFAREQTRWRYQGGEVGLPFENGAIPARTLILSGTPGGVIYAPPTTRQIFLGISQWFFTLHWLNPNTIIEPNLRESYASGRFLKAGDEVVMRADRLGSIVNKITK